MEERGDLKSILEFLPLILRSSSLFWPTKALESLKALALGPDISRVDSGEILYDAILDLRESVGLSHEWIAPRSAEGYALFFDELMSRMDSRAWFGEVIPGLARLLLQMPSLLEAHYCDSNETFGDVNSRLQIIGQQEACIVFMNQQLIAALLACALFCLFRSSNRGEIYLPSINFDQLFAALYPNAKQSQEQKIRCLMHYFERICHCMPTGVVSYERKVLPLNHTTHCISYPEDVFWRTSVVSLCAFEVFPSGLIEDQQHEALEVDFANEYLGGGALHRGCVQEEIRFMINPELIAGMLFMTSMAENEAIEIVGVERFSRYMGYGSSFRFVGDYLDKTPLDTMGRRKTRIVAIDALCSPGMRQYGAKCLLRETNKAFCGFYDTLKCQGYLKLLKEVDSHKNQFRQSEHKVSEVGCSTNSFDGIGIATGNWGCGAFGGDPEIKGMIQWLAAAQASRPFIQYYTFGEAALQRLEKVTRWILMHKWTVGDLWSLLVEYSSQRLNREINIGFLDWLLPEDDASE